MGDWVGEIEVGDSGGKGFVCDIVCLVNSFGVEIGSVISVWCMIDIGEDWMVFEQFYVQLFQIVVWQCFVEMFGQCLEDGLVFFCFVFWEDGM